MGNFTCKGCGSRHPGCYATCETYKAEKAELDARSAAIRKQKEIQDGLDYHVIKTMYRMSKRRGIQKPSQTGGQ